MSIDHKPIDTQLLSNVQESISEITDLSFSTYDTNDVLLAPQKSEDRLAVQIKSYASGREEHEKFIRSGIKQASLRKDVSILAGVANQHHLFIPICVSNAKLVLVSSPFYLVRTEFEDFLIKKGQRFGLSLSHLNSWQEVIKVRDYPSVQKIGDHVKFIVETLMQGSYEKNLHRKRYQRDKTLMDVLFNLHLPMPIKEVYSIVIDAILFLFDVNTVSIMAKEENFFRTVVASGKLKDDIRHISIEESNPLISRSMGGFMPASTNNITEISELGFSDNITSINVFPLSYSKSNYEAVMIYNSVVPRQESYSILEFCKLISLVICSLVLQNTRDKYIDALLRLKNSVMKLLIQPRDPNSIYDSIIDAAAELLNAEKASLMLLEADNLRIKAVRGINKWLVQDIRIKMGECIAGKVLQEGKTLHVKEVKKELPYIKPKSHYKTGSFVCMPLKFGSETIGILNITDKAAGEEFTEMDLNLLNHLASNISMVLKMSNYCWLAEQMKELSITDHLTGLFNRRYLQERFSEEIYRSERHNLTFSLEMFDIDNFKLFNDTEGHIAGDDILKGIASVASKSLRINDIIARFGGEEFVIIMPQTDKEKKEAFGVAERIRKNIKEFFAHKWEKFPHPYITVSIGIASFPDDGTSINELIESADKALYRAKSMGKDRIVIYKD